MKGQLLRKFVLVISVVILFSISAQAFAAEPRATYYIESQGGSITRGTDNIFTIHYTVSANRVMDRIGVYYIQIQRSTDQENWTPESTLHSSSYPEWMNENSMGNMGSTTYSGTRGYYYRAKIGFLAKIGSDSETTYKYTNTIYIPQSGNGGRTN